MLLPGQFGSISGNITKMHTSQLPKTPGGRKKSGVIDYDPHHPLIKTLSRLDVTPDDGNSKMRENSSFNIRDECLFGIFMTFFFYHLLHILFFSVYNN